MGNIKIDTYGKNLDNGRFGCMSIREDGHIVLLVDNTPVTISVTPEQIENIRRLAVAGKGSLYVNKINGHWYVVDTSVKYVVGVDKFLDEAVIVKIETLESLSDRQLLDSVGWYTAEPVYRSHSLEDCESFLNEMYTHYKVYGPIY
jgi:hypothetical protein